MEIITVENKNFVYTVHDASRNYVYHNELKNTQIRLFECDEKSYMRMQLIEN